MLCTAISFIIFLPITIALLALTEGQAQSISIVSLATYLIVPQFAFGFTLYAVLYNRTPESVIEAPKERIKASKPDSGEQIDQRKRQMLRAGIAGSSFNTCHLPWTRKPSFPAASSSEHNLVTIISIPAEVEEHQTKGI